jgi:hypothetical protein
MVKKMRIVFDESDPKYELKKQRTDIIFKIGTMPQNYDKLEYNRLQHELAKINKKIRGF